MEASTTHPDHDVEEEYILFDLGDVSLQDLPPNAPYVLSGLDTSNPVLTICDKYKMVGKYEETVGTCLTFTEEEVPVAEASEGNEGVEGNEGPRKELKLIGCVHKILKFKLLPDSPIPSSTPPQTKP